MRCNVCEGSGFKNVEQIPQEIQERGFDSMHLWMTQNTGHDVAVCDCCGDGDSSYGVPGEHYGPEDPMG